MSSSTATPTSFRPRWGAVAVVVAALGGVVFIGEDAREPHGPLPIDTSVLHNAVVHRSSALVSVARVLSHMGDPLVLLVIAVLATALLWRRFRTVFPTVLPIGALLVAAVIEATAKRVIGRPRPPVVYHLVAESSASFPSGHATGSAAFYVALALVLSPSLRHRAARVTAVAGALVLAALIAAARVVLGVHWVSDVTAGWLLGVSCAVAAGLVADALLGRSDMAWANGGRSSRVAATAVP
jgi:membrane-associated phospholipid phosphatase